MNVNVQKKLQIFRLCLHTPYARPVEEVFFIISARRFAHDFKGYSHTAVIGDVFANGKLTVYPTPRKFNAVKLFNHIFDLFVELFRVFLGPPVVKVTKLVTFCAVRVERV